ncbi:transcriptional regulator GutM [Rubrobacter indicoceani]|uniref:transcriptional regulator GutM n=1 Tax=Rubrobacter indicoceani TaxID=2051957 RepID=UPI0013C3ED17|nr:transcriptional regulator GutM [Rubrobacter indicoceani]
MSFVYFVIPVLAALWLLQGVGTYFQMTHYRKVLGGITEAGGEGYVGVGNAKGKFGKGVILILVFDRDRTVTNALRMRGMTVFARFEAAPELVGLEAGKLEEIDLKEPYDAGTMLAARRAVEQIRRIEAEQRKVEGTKPELREVRVG